MKRTIRMKGDVYNARGTFTAGEVLTGWEWNVRPLVDSGAAEWYEPEPEPEPVEEVAVKARSKPKKKAKAEPKDEVKDGPASTD